MYALVISENKMVSALLSKNLNCENIINEQSTIQDDYKNTILINNYDCVIFKMTSNANANIKVIQIINEVYPFKTKIILIDKNQIQFIENLNLFSWHIYPYDIPSIYLANEIKKISFKSKEISEESIIKVNDITLDLNKREVERFGKKQFLRNKEFQLLKFFMKNTDILLSRQVILENVWDRNAYFITNTVDVHVNCLRRKIDYKKSKQLIETIYCSGYIFHSKPTINN